MAGRNVSIRLGIDGAAEAKAALENFGQSGTAATAKLKSSLKALASGDVTGKFADQLAGAAAKVAAAQKALASVPDGDTTALAAAQQRVASATDSYTSALARKRAQLIPAAAAEGQLAKVIADTAAAERLGAISAAEAAEARSRAQSSYSSTVASLKQIGAGSSSAAASVKGGQMALRDFALQAQDFAVQVSSGQGFFQPLLQQGSQVAQQLQASGQGFGALKSAAGIALGAIVSPMGLLVTGAAAAAGAIAILGVTAEHESTRLGDLRQQLRATRDDYVGLADSIDLAAKKAAATATISTADSRSAAQTIGGAKYFAGTTDDILQLTRMSVDLARVWNTDIPTAAARLRDAINDPAAAAAKFAGEGLPAFNQALVTNVTLLERAGKASEAQKIVRDALSQSSKGAATDESALSKALRELQQAFTGAETGGKSFGNTLGTFINDQVAATIKDVTSVVKELNDVADFIRRNASKVSTAFSAPLIDQNTGKAPTGITLPNGASNDIYRVAEANGIAPELADFFTRIIGKGEHSPGQYAANGSVLTSPAGAIGLSQVMPATAADKSINPTGSLDPTKLDDNILLGLRYLAQLSKNYNGNEQLTAAAYNAGPGRMADVLAGKATLPDETAKYVKNVTGSAFGTVAASDDRKDHQGATSSANAALAADNRRLSDSIGADTAGTRAMGSLGNSADLEKTAKQLQIVNDQIEALKANGDTSSDAFRQATAQADGLKQKTQELLAAERNRLDPQQQFLRGLQDQVAANAGLTEGEQRVIQLRQQMADIERNQGGSFTPEQRAAALGLLSQSQQQELARQVDTMRTAAAGQDNLAAAYGKGYDAVGQSTAATAGYTASLKFGVRGSDEQRAAAANLTAEFERQAAAANKVAIAQATRSNADQLTYIEAETASLGRNDDARTAYLAHKQAEILLTSKNIALTGDEGAAYLASVDKISAASAALKGQEAALGELTGFVDNTFSTISDSIVSAFATGEHSAVRFKDVAGSVVKAVEAEFLKLALINPLKNLLLGSNSPTLSSVTGIVGQLLGNNGNSSSSSSPFDGAGVSIGPFATSSGSGGLSISDVAGAAGTLGTLAKGVDYLTGGHLVSDLSSTLKSTFSGVSSYSLYSSTPTAGQTVSAAAADDFSSAGGSLSGGSSGGVNITAGSALGIVGGAYSAYSGFERGGVGGTVQGVGGLASAGLAVAGTGLLGSGAAGLAAAAGPYAPIALAAIAIIGALLPGAHPKHPFEDTELNIANGHLQAGKSDGQLEDFAALKVGTQKYADGVNTYLDSVGIRIANADGNLGRIGEGITGLSQTLDPNTLFNKLTFENDPSDTSQFGVAKGALQGMTFANPQALSDELAKIASFADATSMLGIQLTAVGKDISAIQIASVTGANPDGTSTVTDASGRAITYHSDLRTALNADLPTQTFADTAALDAEMQKVSDFVTGTLPSLLTPAKHVDSTLQDQIQVMNQKYADAAAQSRSYGLNNDQALLEADQRAVQIMMKPAVDGVLATMAGINVRLATATSGTSGAGAATLGNLAATQNNERTTLEDQWRQVWGDGIVSNQAYITSMQQLVDAQNAEVQATQQQIAITQAQGLAGLLATEASNAQAAGINGLGASLAAFDAKAADQRLEFIKAWTDYYGQAAAGSQELQDQLLIMDKASAAQRLQVQQSYSDASVAALKTAQGSVTSLFGSLKDYALKLQTGSQSALSPTSQYDLAKSQFNAVAGAASAGDAASASQLTTYADALLSTSQAVNGSGAAYASDYSKVLDALQGVSAAGDVLTQSFMQQQTQDVVSSVQAVQSAVSGVQTEIAALRREMQQQTRANAA